MSGEGLSRTRFDTQWLTGPAAQVQDAAARADFGEIDQPPWHGRRGRRWAAVSACALLWFLAIVWVVLASRADQVAGLGFWDGVAIAVTTVMAVAWGRWTQRRYDTAGRPGEEERLRVHRLALTARANGYRLEPQRATFSSLMTGEQRGAHCYPRFAADGVEFGNLRARGQSHAEWRYLTVQLPGPQPHLFFQSSAAGDLPPELPRLDAAEHISLGGVFDRTFRFYAPRPYATDALFLLPTNVMAALIDHAADFHIEIRDNRLIFFAPAFADFTHPATWHTIGGLLRRAVPPLMARAERYRDQDVPRPEHESEETRRRRAAYQEVVEEMGFHWLKKPPSIGKVGRRLQLRKPKGEWRRFYLALWYWFLTMLFVLPAGAAIAGFLGVIGVL